MPPDFWPPEVEVDDDSEMAMATMIDDAEDKETGRQEVALR